MTLNDSIVGKPCYRLPHGRTCHVVAVDHVRRMIKVADPTVWTGWIAESTFVRQWKVVDPQKINNYGPSPANITNIG